MDFLYDVLSRTWDFMFEASFWLLLGLFIAGLLYVYLPLSKIHAYLGGRGFGPILRASILGIPIPLCSCGVVPTALSLRRMGASKSATLAFLISTPETGVDSISLTYALMHPIMVIARPVAAFVTAVVCGIGETLFGEKEKPREEIPESLCAVCGLVNAENHSHSHARKIQRVLKYAYIEFLGDIAVWLLVGLVLSGVVGTFLRPEWVLSVRKTLGPGGRPAEMVVMLLAGIPIYVCATAATPIAASLLLAGVSPGAVLVFLLAGPATNVASLTLVARYMGRVTTAIYLASIVLVSVAMGFVLNWISDLFEIHFAAKSIGHGELIPPVLQWVATVLLSIFIVVSVIYRYQHKGCVCD